MGKHINTYQKELIISMKSAGHSSRHISRELKVNNKMIDRMFSLYEAGESLERKVGSGRKRKTSPHTDRLIIREVRRNRFITAQEIQKNLISVVDSPDNGLNPSVNISLTSIRRRIKESGEFNSYWAAEKPYISEINKQKRVEWAIAHKDWKTITLASTITRLKPY